MCWKCFTGALAVVVLVFALWTTSYSKWIIVVAAAILLIKSLMHMSCCGCGDCCVNSKGMKSGKK